ncbi:phosphohydrolase [Photobacterium frigidiphilum]|uniref:Phosphohydrolase n=1 Tax=Photobacterium frigidiphilum TaxID=264736 RepID=A0A2T3J823_9GAMM|nr:HD domain-containing protein [Photobacterium frigidiphilum]PSU44890.1 phosphohydrolase [Photobacterium frigidiphilum]
MNNRYIKARTLARVKHIGQQYGERPYYSHLETVSRLASPFGINAMIVAQLHDVIEDTETSVDELAADFGFLVADAVKYMTDGKLTDRMKRKIEINQRLASLDIDEEAGRLALIVKACDRLANVRASKKASEAHFKMYQQEHNAFKQAVYRKGLCEAIWWELDTLIERRA